jgi:hypothetical protein
MLQFVACLRAHYRELSPALLLARSRELVDGGSKRTVTVGVHQLLLWIVVPAHAQTHQAAVGVLRYGGNAPPCQLSTGHFLAPAGQLPLLATATRTRALSRSHASRVPVLQEQFYREQ